MSGPYRCGGPGRPVPTGGVWVIVRLDWGVEGEVVEYEPKSKEQQQLESALKDLINYGADVNQKDENHITPVFEVVYQGTVQTLQFLLSHEGDVNRRDRYEMMNIIS